MNTEFNTTKSHLDSLRILFGKFPLNNDGLAIKGNTLLKCKNKKLEHCSVPEGITIICDSAFSGLKNLKTVTLPSSIEAIGDSAFYNCKNLSEIDLPDSLKFIGDSAFNSCKSLKQLIIPEGCEEIGNWAIPTSLSTLTSYSSKVPSPEAFEGFSTDEKIIPENPNMTVYATGHINRKLHKIEEVIKVTHLNGKYSCSLPSGKDGMLLTTAFLRFELGEGAYRVKIGELESMVIAPRMEKIKITVYDERSKLLLEAPDFLIDERLYLDHVHFHPFMKEDKSPLIQTMSSLRKKEYIDNWNNYKGIFDSVFWKILQNHNQSQPLNVEIIKATDEKPIVFVAPIRVLDSELNLGNLEFGGINFSRIGAFDNFFKEILKEDCAIINVFTYQNELSVGYFPIQENPSKDMVIDEFALEMVEGRKAYNNALGWSFSSRLIKTVGRDDAMDEYLSEKDKEEEIFLR